LRVEQGCKLALPELAWPRVHPRETSRRPAEFGRARGPVPREPPHRENPRYRNGEDGAGVRVPPADINGKDLNPMVKAARVNNTPEQLVARLAEANDTNYVGTSLTRRRQG
jgi:hypothetical protein